MYKYWSLSLNLQHLHKGNPRFGNSENYIFQIPPPPPPPPPPSAKRHSSAILNNSKLCFYWNKLKTEFIRKLSNFSLLTLFKGYTKIYLTVINFPGYKTNFPVSGPYRSPYLPNKIIFGNFLCLYSLRFSTFLAQNLNFFSLKVWFLGKFCTYLVTDEHYFWHQNDDREMIATFDSVYFM